MTEPESYYFEENSGIPNNPGLPVLVYRGAVSAADPDELEERFRENDIEFPLISVSFHKTHIISTLRFR